MAENKLRLQSQQKSTDQTHAAEKRKVNSSLSTLDQAIKTGDSRKADVALAAANAAVRNASANKDRATRAYTDTEPTDGDRTSGFSAWA